MTQSTERLRFVDELRGLATLVMLEVHVVDALLAPRYRQTEAYFVLHFLNGLVAPSFLLCAGFAVALTMRSLFAGKRTGKEALVAGLRRGGKLLGWGYLLHISTLLWTGFQGEAGWRQFLQSDILQVIGLSVIALSALGAATAQRLRFAALSLSLAVGMLLLTPTLRSLNVAGWPRWLAPYFSTTVPTQFPLFPWMAFPFFGAALAALSSTLGRTKILQALALSGGLALLAALVLKGLGPLLLPPHDPWSTGPWFSLQRVGIILFLLFALAALEKVQRGQVLSAVEKVILRFSKHSLLIYLAHIPLIYGGIGRSLASSIGPCKPPEACLAWFFALALGMYLLATVVETLRGRVDARRHPAHTARSSGFSTGDGS